MNSILKKFRDFLTLNWNSTSVPLKFELASPDSSNIVYSLLFQLFKPITAVMYIESFGRIKHVTARTECLA